jgi:hypothetical protein
MTETRRQPWVLLAGVAALLAEWGVTRTAAFARGGVVPFAVLVDLVLVLPVLYYFVALRPAKRSLLRAAPVLALGVWVAAALLGSRADTAPIMRVVAPVAELVALALLAHRLRAASRQFRAAEGDDFLLRVEAMPHPLLRLLAAELAVFYYAFRALRAPRPMSANEFGYTEKSGAGPLLLAFALLTAIEGVVVHLFLVASLPRVAWIVSAVHAYGLVWLFAAFQAARLRPLVVYSDRLLVRTSFLWTAVVPRAAIAAVTHVAGAPRAKGLLVAAFAAPPELLLTLVEPVIARGPMGIRRSVDRIALYVDDPGRLVVALGRGR